MSACFVNISLKTSMGKKQTPEPNLFHEWVLSKTGMLIISRVTTTTS